MHSMNFVMDQDRKQVMQETERKEEDQTRVKERQET